MSERAYLIAKAQDGRSRSGLAEAGVGLGLAAGTPAAYRVERGYRQKATQHIERRRKRAVSGLERSIADLGTPAPRVVPDITRGGRRARPARGNAHTRFASGETPKQKAARQAAKRDLYGRIGEVNAKANRRKASWGRMRHMNRQTRAWGTGIGLGVPLLVHGTRRASSSPHKGDATAVAAGAAGGGLALHGASIATKPLEKPAEQAIRDSPELSRILREHRKKTLPKNARAGDPAWKTYNRTYPKQLPGVRSKRFWSHATSGRRGVAFTGLAALAGGSGTAYTRRSQG